MDACKALGVLCTASVQASTGTAWAARASLFSSLTLKQVWQPWELTRTFLHALYKAPSPPGTVVTSPGVKSVLRG